ncbi:MAG: SDR family oxidoreductase [Candidatus Hydrogenedentes bacterium]|nr:SDR family oxidoreductase [Candidatus Hydrogenedentota bacterium]
MANEGNRVLLAGATGTLGRALLRALQDRAYQVHPVARPGSIEKLRSAGVAEADIRIAEVTNAESVSGLCADVDIVVSALGITRQQDGLSYDDVDYGANALILQDALRAGVNRFAYVSVLGADLDLPIPVLRAKFRFEQALRASGIPWLIFRPSGFFTDMEELYHMARKGTVHLVGNGRNRITPIHAADLAALIVRRLPEGESQVAEVGGPETCTWNEAARCCFEVLGREPRVMHWPAFLLDAAVGGSRLVAPRWYGVLSFMRFVFTRDQVAPELGTTRLKEYLASLS